MSGRSGTGKSSARTAMRRLHMWLGLTLGLLFAVAGITGSTLVFYPELDRAIHPALREVDSGTRPLSWEAVYAALRRDHPGRTGAWRIEVTPNGGPIPVRYYKPPETAGRDFAPLLLWVDPASLRTIRSAFWGDTAVTWIYDLHYRLLLEKPGGAAMGVASLAMLALLVSGLWAWWPRPGTWRRAVRVKPEAAPLRRLYDLHKISGLFGLMPLLVITATGAMLDLPDQVRPIIARTSALFKTPALASSPQAGGMLPIDAFVRQAQARFPGAELAWIETPAGPTGTVRVNLAQAGEPSRRFPRTNLWFDPYSGRVLAVRDGLRDSSGDTLLNWMHPIHGGEAFGLFGRVLTLICGLLPTALLITGLLRWSKRSARHRKHKVEFEANAIRTLSAAVGLSEKMHCSSRPGRQGD